MKIDLKYILKRNKTDLKAFVSKNNIKTYEQLVLICEERSFNPVDREEFESIMPPAPEKKNEKPVKKQKAETPAKAQTKRRRTSSTTRKRRTRVSSKDVNDT